MTETATVQFNNLIPLPFAQAYIKIPSGLKNLPSGAQLVGGLIYSFSGLLDNNGVYSTICRTRKAMKDGLLLSLSTLSRNIAKLVNKGYVSRLSRDEYIFNRDKLKSPDEFTRIEFNEIAELLDEEYLFRFYSAGGAPPGGQNVIAGKGNSHKRAISSLQAGNPLHSAYAEIFPNVWKKRASRVTV